MFGQMLSSPQVANHNIQSCKDWVACFQEVNKVAPAAPGASNTMDYGFKWLARAVMLSHMWRSRGINATLAADGRDI